jgi:DNA-directed RNA polymerase subunit RPC12/RpoP
MKELRLSHVAKRGAKYYFYLCPTCGSQVANRRERGRAALECNRCAHKTHGQSTTREYVAYHAMKQRCYNRNVAGYDDYGGRGITVCAEWLASFEVYRRDMGPRPSPKHSVDRIDCDKGYSPDNCRWATPDVQSRNKQVTVHVTLGSETRVLIDWLKFYRIPPNSYYRRVRRGMTPAQALADLIATGRFAGGSQ